MGTTGLMVVKDFGLPVLNDEMGKAWEEEMSGLQITFDRIKIPSGGGLVFELPGDDPENPETVKELIGIIIDHYPVNAYWKEKYSGQNNPPDCKSQDGKTGVGNPGGACKTCIHNQWGSGEMGVGKACKNMHRIYLLREGEMFPLLLTLPPTSLKNFADYLAKRIITKGRRSYEVITKITLKKAVSTGGITYSQAMFAVEGVLNPELTQKIAQYAENLRPLTRAMAITSEDYSMESEETTVDTEEEIF